MATGRGLSEMRFAPYDDDGGVIRVGVLGDGERLHELASVETIEVLAMRAFINGELLGEDSLANMAWTFEELLSFASRGSFVGPTDPLASGTHQRRCLTEI